MSEVQYRADMLMWQVEEIEVVNETANYVDYKVQTGWVGGSLRREAKDTSQSSVHKTKQEALQALKKRAGQEFIRARRELSHWKEKWIAIEQQLGTNDELPKDD